MSCQGLCCCFHSAHLPSTQLRGLFLSAACPQEAPLLLFKPHDFYVDLWLVWTILSSTIRGTQEHIPLPILGHLPSTANHMREWGRDRGSLPLTHNPNIVHLLGSHADEREVGLMPHSQNTAHTQDSNNWAGGPGREAGCARAHLQSDSTVWTSTWQFLACWVTVDTFRMNYRLSIH